MTRDGRRPSIELDGEWRFVADPERLYGADRLPEGDPIRVPGCWEAQVSRPYRIITAWYRRHIEVPRDWQGDRVVARFGAVMYRCAVFLNGRRMGEHEGGYTPFEVDLAEAIRWDGPNEIAVQVVNPLNAIDEYPAFSVEEIMFAQEFEPDLPLAEAPHGKQTWYSSQSGIWQSVRLERRPSAALAPLRVRPDLPGKAADIAWSLEGAGGRRAPDGLEVRVIDPQGGEVASERVGIGADAGAGELRIGIPDPLAWDIDQPNLYRVEARLLAGGEVVDAVEARFGMRSIETRDGRILLNGRPIYLLGALDQDLYPDTISTPPSREMLDRQVRLAREMGINLLRCHIKVPDPAYLDAADEAGILVWCELPNWSRFSSAAAARGRETLRQMVATLGNHPSIVIWTIVNEDWGTQLRYEARDRLWLRETYDWLKGLDPTRLVVDNSACETPTTPNFHLATDLADFHIYFVAPDNAARWKNMTADYARRPNWLFSPHGDALPRGDEPLVLSEFGSWGLPRLDRLIAHTGREPWWFGTGRHYYLPTGIRRRFAAYGLDRVWPSVEDLAEATQWHQFDGLQYEIGQLRRHDSIQGYVITELSDAYWEANGLLDAMRGTKAYHDRLHHLNAPTVVVPDVGRRDLYGGGQLEAEIHLSSYDARAEGGRVAWELAVADGSRVAGEIPVGDWPSGGARLVGSIAVDVPHVAAPTDATLVVRALDGAGVERARDDVRLAILPIAAGRTEAALDVAVHDPLDIWGLASRVESLGHRVVRRGVPEVADGQNGASPELLVAAEATDRLRDHVEAGGRALILVRTRSAIPEGHDLARRVAIHLRRLPHSGWPGQRSPWEGDWVTSWSWILHDELPGLPRRNPLDFAYEEVLPDHVLLGYDPARHRDEVPAGMFVGWVHTPAALVWTFRQGRGAVTVTTFRVAPESGPVATVLLEQLIQRAARADRRSGSRDQVGAGANGGAGR
ncbi:MAG TPA: sugar-binding domain-containing protein [Candidatus Limnocylindrales bacterium]